MLHESYKQQGTENGNDKIAKRIEKLSSKSGAVRGSCKSEIISLPADNANEVFVQLLQRVKGSPSLKTKPPALDGLVHLCQHRRELQLKLVELLEGLPIENLGGNFTVGFAAALTSSQAQQKFRRLLHKWASQSINKELKLLAEVALQIYYGDEKRNTSSATTAPISFGFPNTYPYLSKEKP